MCSVVTIHPRLMDRLEKTLTERLRAFESECDRTRQIVDRLLRQIDSFESEFGLSLAECRGECHQALSDIDALDPYAKDAVAEIEPVLQRFVRVAALLEGLDVPALLAAAEDSTQTDCCPAIITGQRPS